MLEFPIGAINCAGCSWFISAAISLYRSFLYNHSGFPGEFVVAS